MKLACGFWLLSSSRHRHCVDFDADIADVVYPSRKSGPCMYGKSIAFLQARHPLCLGGIFRVCAPHDLVSEPVPARNRVSEDLSVLAVRKCRNGVIRPGLRVVCCGQQFLCCKPGPATSISITCKALVVGVDAEDDLADGLEHSGDGSRDLTGQELLGSLMLGDALYRVESSLAGCAVIELGVLDYRWNDVAHQLLLQEEHGMIDVMNVARARIHGWFTVRGLMSCFK